MTRRFIILFTGRSGSTWCKQLLNRRDGLFCEDEKFAPENLPAGVDQIEALRHFYDAPPRSVHTLGLKLKAVDVADPGRLRTLVDELDIRVITLTRRNPARRAISIIRGIELAERTGRWNLLQAHDEATPPGEIAPAELLAHIRACEREDAGLEQLALSMERPVLSLWYEHLQKHLLAEIVRIEVFLGLGRPHRLPEVDIRKNTPEDLSAAVTNLTQLRAALVDTPYAWTLDG